MQQREDSMTGKAIITSLAERKTQLGNGDGEAESDKEKGRTAETFIERERERERVWLENENERMRMRVREREKAAEVWKRRTCKMCLYSSPLGGPVDPTKGFSLTTYEDWLSCTFLYFLST